MTPPVSSVVGYIPEMPQITRGDCLGTANETMFGSPMTRLFIILLIAVIMLVAVIQGAFLPGIIASMGVVGLYYFAILVNRSEERKSRIDLIDERLFQLENRVRDIEEVRGSSG